MENDKGAFFLLDLGDGLVKTHDNAEAARKEARQDELLNPNNTRRLFKVLPYSDPIEIMV